MPFNIILTYPNHRGDSAARLSPHRSVPAGVAETSRAAPADLEVLHHLKGRLDHRHEHHLRDTLPTVITKGSALRFQHETNTWPW